MRIVNLIENTEGVLGCTAAHGLSFYIETGNHKLLCDLGPSDETIKNAEKLGINLEEIDTVILSHGHYDHSGGIIPFTRINDKATIFMQKCATGDFYSYNAEQPEGERYRYIGIDKEIADLEQVRFVEGDLEIDDELELFTIKGRTSHPLPFTNKRLYMKKGDEYINDNFVHEQYLVIKDGDRRILVSGCAHNGMNSILDAYRSKYGSDPDLVISGFHLMKKTEYTDDELGEIIDIAKSLKNYNSRFVTCHCTGTDAYKVMKNIMGDRLSYVHSGDEVEIKYLTFDDEAPAAKKQERRSSYMKWHKFFAWATVACFVLTMITGYKKK